MSYASIRRTSLLLLGLAWAAVWPSHALPADQPLKNILIGESALAFSAGYIRQAMPLDGVVSQITGDNQTTGNRRLLGTTDIVYLHLTKPEEVAPGDLFTLYRRTNKVFHPLNTRYLGDLILVLGIGRIVKVTDGLATVRIVRSFGAINPADSAMRFALPPEKEPAPSVRRLPETPGAVVAFQGYQTLIAQRNVVYVDWGREDGLRLGDRLEVYRIGSGLPQRVIAELKILALEDFTATALVVRSTAHVLRGDRFTFKEGAEDGAVAGEQPETAMQELERLAKATPATATPAPAPAPTEVVRASRPAGDPQELINSLVDQLEYEPGQVVLAPAGLEILKQVADILKDLPDTKFSVEGHTDNQEIGPTLKLQYPTNDELSQARAGYTVRYFVEEAGLDPATISQVGYAYRQAVASNATMEGRKKNRRIEIVLAPKTPATPPENTLAPLPANGLSPEPAPPSERPAIRP